MKDFLYKSLDKCDAIDCHVLFLRALNNVRVPENVPVFSKYMADGPRKVSIAAAKAMHNLPLSYFKTSDMDFFESIYSQLRRKHDSTVRTIAADILLRANPSVDRLRFLLSTLGDQESHELKTFIVERLKDLTQLDPVLKRNIESLHSEKRLNNYHVWGQRGRSTAFTRYLYDDASKGSNGSFVAAMELGGGMLKRIKFDVNLGVDGDGDSLSTLLTVRSCFFFLWT